MISEIQTAIINKLNDITELNGIYTYEVASPTEGRYPFATLTFLSSTAVFGDTVRNEREYSFILKIYQERVQASFGNEKAENVLITIVDNIINAFDLDTTMNDTVKFVRPLNVSLNYLDREIGDTRVAEIQLDCFTVVPSA